MLITSSNWRLFFLRDLVVKLDGEVQTHVIEADDEDGYIVRGCVDESGKFISDGVGRTASWKKERVEGRVEFIGTKRRSPTDIKSAAAAKRARRRARNLRIAGGA